MLLKRGGVFEVQELMFACKLNATFHVDVTTWQEAGAMARSRLGASSQERLTRQHYSPTVVTPLTPWAKKATVNTLSAP